MTEKRISLELRDNNKLVRSIQVIFGLVCIAISVFWLIYNSNTEGGTGTLWLTLLFLTGFGIFQIYSGLGYAQKYIEFGGKSLKVKSNSLLPVVEMDADDIELAEVFPLKIHLNLKNGKKVLIRLGVTDNEKIDLVKDEITRFVTDYNVPLEIKNE